MSFEQRDQDSMSRDWAADKQGVFSAVAPFSGLGGDAARAAGGLSFGTVTPNELSEYGAGVGGVAGGVGGCSLGITSCRLVASTYQRQFACQRLETHHGIADCTAWLIFLFVSLTLATNILPSCSLCDSLLHCYTPSHTLAVVFAGGTKLGPKEQAYVAAVKKLNEAAAARQQLDPISAFGAACEQFEDKTHNTLMSTCWKLLGDILAPAQSVRDASPQVFTEALIQVCVCEGCVCNVGVCLCAFGWVHMGV